MWTDALPSDQRKLLCKARHSIAVQLHLSLSPTFWRKVGKSQLPPPQIMLESCPEWAWFQKQCEATGRCKLQGLTGAFRVLSLPFLLGETERPLDLFIFGAECILTSQGSEFVIAVEQGVSSSSTS